MLISLRYSSTLHVTLISSLLALGACAKKDDAATPPPKEPPAPVATADAAPPPAPEKPAFIEVTGFATPESVLVLADQDLYLVSNIQGGPAEADDNGFISKLGADGKIVELKWIDGAKDTVKLNAPKGMAVRGGKLYVADIDTVRIFDLATGEPKGDIPIKGASFLNDVAAFGDKVYVTDTGVDPSFKPTGTDAVYEIDAKDKAKKLVAGQDLAGPNGLLVEGGQVWVASYFSKDFYRIDGGKKVDVNSVPTGGLDGFAALGDGRIAVSSWEGKAIYAGKPGEPFKALIESVEAPADFAVDVKRKRIAVPLFMGNTVRFYSFE